VHVAVRGTGARRRDERPACATLAWGPCLPATLYVRGREWTRRGRGVMLIEKACTFQLDCDERRGWGGARRPLVTSAAGDWIEAMTHVGGAVVPPACSVEVASRREREDETEWDSGRPRGAAKERGRTPRARSETRRRESSESSSAGLRRAADCRAVCRDTTGPESSGGA
jgi:hypothetical protein